MTLPTPDVCRLAALAAAVLAAPAVAQCEVARVNATDPQEGQYMGRVVSLDGDILVAGGIAEGLIVDAVFVFRFDGSAWSEEAVLTASDGKPEEEFGSVSVSGDVVLVGAYNADPDGIEDAGAVYVYRYDGSTWIEEQKLTSPDADAGDSFGIWVSVRGDVALIGASGDDEAGEFAGAAYAYRYDGTSWILEQKLIPSELSAGDALGFPVVLSPCGTLAVIGAPYDDHAGQFSGAAYVYRHDGTAWVEETRLTASDAGPGSYFGFGASIDRDVVAIGAFGDEDGGGAFTGAAYVFHRDGSAWVEEAKIVPAGLEAGDMFGGDVNVSGNLLAVGATGDDDGGDEAGAAYVFRRIAGTWGPGTKIVASDASANTAFGNIVWIEGDHLAVGSPFDDEGGTDTGSVYVFAGMLGVDYDANGVADVCEALCPADATGDGVIDFEDILVLLSDWGPCQ